MSGTRIGAAALLLAVLWCFALPAESTIQLCAFHWLTGLKCPLCGLTHALFALAKGRVREAIDWNTLSPLGFAMLFSLFWRFPGRDRLWAWGIVAFGVYGVLRAAGLA